MLAVYGTGLDAGLDDEACEQRQVEQKSRCHQAPSHGPVGNARSGGAQVVVTESGAEPARYGESVGRRLATKILNVSRLILGFADLVPVEPKPLDRLVNEALGTVEVFFWSFCDDYVELVKSRAYDGDASAVHTLKAALETLLKLFAPFLPFVTDEVWSQWKHGSIHRAAWPTPIGAPARSTGAPLVLAAELLHQVRGAKSRAHVALTTPVDVARIVLPADQKGSFEIVREDLQAAGRIIDFEVVTGEELAVAIELGGTTVHG